MKKEIQSKRIDKSDGSYLVYERTVTRVSGRVRRGAWVLVYSSVSGY